MFIIVLISIFLIANPALGMLPKKRGKTPIIRTEGEILTSVYEYLINWFGINEENPFTIDRFYDFVGDSEEHIVLINGYFLLYKTDDPNKVDNIELPLFKKLITFICIGTLKKPIPFTNELVAEFNRLREEALRNYGGEIVKP